MSADILVYQADFVPVGQDQAVHVEITREIARRFNHFYSGKKGDPAGAEGSADAIAQAAGDRWPQDVEELRKHDPAQ